MNERAKLKRILERDKVIAVVGLSRQPYRPSHSVSVYMQSHGYRIVPINPAYSNDTAGVLGERCYATLHDARASLAEEGVVIEMVDVFRRSDEVASIVDDAISIGARSLWLQLGVIDDASAKRAENAGLDVAMDCCVMVEHGRLIGTAQRISAPAPRLPQM
jgi:uncharacterized protein